MPRGIDDLDHSGEMIRALPVEQGAKTRVVTEASKADAAAPAGGASEDWTARRLRWQAASDNSSDVTSSYREFCVFVTVRRNRGAGMAASGLALRLFAGGGARKMIAAARRLRWRLLKPALEKTGAIRVVFRRWERRAARRACAPFDDGLPMPPPNLRVGVAGAADATWFSESGRRDARAFEEAAGRHGVTLSRAGGVIDLGCGCGRIARWLAPRVAANGGVLSGFDINPRMAAWCGANLAGRYGRNRLRPPLAAAEGRADVLYAYSVLTHLREATAVVWLAEIARVLKPGGLALLTFHGEAYAAACGPPEVRAALGHRPYFVLNDALEGSNYISAWTTRAHFSALAARHFDVLEIAPGRADLAQALAVLRRR